MLSPTSVGALLLRTTKLVNNDHGGTTLCDPIPEAWRSPLAELRAIGLNDHKMYAARISLGAITVYNSNNAFPR